MNDDDPFCASCGAGSQVNWSPAFGLWLCPMCRTQKTHALLDQKVTALPVRDDT